MGAPPMCLKCVFCRFPPSTYSIILMPIVFKHSDTDASELSMSLQEG